MASDQDIEVSGDATIRGIAAARVRANCFVDGFSGTFLASYNMVSVTKVSTGVYTLVTPITDANVSLVTGVLAFDGQPTVITLVPVAPGTSNVLIVHLDGTPVDALWTVTALAIG